jgi:hypothetical protein
MYSFTDAQGRRYNVAITVQSLKRVRDMAGVDLATYLIKPGIGELDLMQQLDLDIVKLIDCIYCIVKPQADSYSVSDEQFGESLEGMSARAAKAAFWGALTDFFQSLGRDAHAKLVKTYMVLQERAMANAMEFVDKAMDHELETIDKKLEIALGKLGVTSTSVQESSESIPILSPPENLT